MVRYMVKPSLYSKGATLHRKAHSLAPALSPAVRRGKSRHQTPRYGGTRQHHSITPKRGALAAARPARRARG